MKKGVLMAQKLYRGRKQRERFEALKEEMAKRAEIERASKERAKAKQQRDEQERTSRAVAGVNHLEIPAELAFIYSKLDGTILINYLSQIQQKHLNSVRRHLRF
jgi:myosin-15